MGGLSGGSRSLFSVWLDEKSCKCRDGTWRRSELYRSTCDNVLVSYDIF